MCVCFSVRRDRPGRDQCVSLAHALCCAVVQEIGEVLEKEEGSKEECVMFFEQAADLFATENSTAEANKCNLKVWGVGEGLGGCMGT